MPKHLSIEKLHQLDKERRLDVNYVNIERSANTKGWKPEKAKKVKIKSNNRLVPKVKKSSYAVFLRSKYWKYVHRLVLERDGQKCTKCGNKSNLQVHHLTYDHHYKEHLYLNELITLCKKCHQAVHSL